MLGLDPAYRGQDERLDRHVLSLALGLIGTGLAFLLAAMFLSFPEWINPRTFATRAFSALRSEVLAGPAPMLPVHRVPFIRRPDTLEDRARDDGGQETANAAADDAGPVGGVIGEESGGAPVDRVLETSRSVLAQALRLPTLPDLLPMDAGVDRDAACVPGSASCAPWTGAIGPRRDVDLPADSGAGPLIADPPALDPVPVVDAAPVVDPAPGNSVSSCDADTPDACVAPPASGSAPPTSPGRGQPPITPPGQSPGTPPGPPITPPGQSPGTPPGLPITPPGRP